MSPGAILRKLKQKPGYFNDRKRTLPGLMRDSARAKTTEERQAIISDRLMWGEMRMDPTDLADVTGLHLPGERPRPRRQLDRPVPARRKGAAALHQRLGDDDFDVRIPGLS